MARAAEHAETCEIISVEKFRDPRTNRDALGVYWISIASGATCVASFIAGIAEVAFFLVTNVDASASQRISKESIDETCIYASLIAVVEVLPIVIWIRRANIDTVVGAWISILSSIGRTTLHAHR